MAEAPTATAHEDGIILYRETTTVLLSWQEADRIAEARRGWRETERNELAAGTEGPQAGAA